MPPNSEGNGRRQHQPATPPAIVSPARSVTPADPNTMLVQRGYAPPRPRPNFIRWMLMLAMAAELFAPEAYKPTHLAGVGAGRFYGEIMDEDNRKRLELAEQQRLAEVLAEREAEYGAWIGRCNIVMMLDPQMGAMCRQAADEFYRDAIEDARRARDRFNQSKQ